MECPAFLNGTIHSLHQTRLCISAVALKEYSLEDCTGITSPADDCAKTPLFLLDIIAVENRLVC